VNASVWGEAHVDNLRFFKNYLKRAPWPRPQDGLGLIAVQMKLLDGKFSEDSLVRVFHPNTGVHWANVRVLSLVPGARLSDLLLPSESRPRRAAE
jgi:hypothetical protein